MLGTLTRSALVGTLFLLAGAGLARAEEELGELVDCAEWISTSFGSVPMSGHLLGTETVTKTTVTQTSASLSGGGPVVNGSGSVTVTETTTVTYEVGYYLMSDGSIQKIDCRTYTLAK